MRDVIKDRILEARKDKTKINPLIVCTCAAVSVQKLRLMLTPEAVFLRSHINVATLKEYLLKTQAAAQIKLQTEGDVLSNHGSS